ncbi:MULTISPECIES: beta-ketoacyl-ACP synthase III [Dictyoglomus]|jgi:3-oxoacyl-[acyl-carrier-protein] synthase-3|uniref:Beta-ketoacyl-[acyl-carrier-protein] synthase III n=1 Tax=Dictyoglomus turgidum (strain DSM 6724 / Z-1310) TaxID=515635 RepID=B8E194_DICTD|nr:MULTISPECIES: beta-ketoacyl-ACP synthase III [Dictyoglomus]ACK42222.1 3-oxoacyl-(acyl-carrier-protein) synthase III [Dictyoglomus turgidum DSM 6724]PNV79845.1 MAG: ketoacyl-ACP synthase III [Dictyoglomus turgidum]HBU32452.1 ketoacyl-ACP synthase III [Dictyoglomus sp.]
MGVGIIGIGTAVPSRVLTNFDLEKMVDTSDEWITTRTGIKERRIADNKTTPSDLGAEAALKAIEMAKISPEEIDLIIVTSASLEMVFPSMAAIIQNKIGAKNAGGFDLLSACTGFVSSVITGAQFIRTGDVKTVLVIGTEVLSRFIDWEDRNTCVLFGDGAGAVILREVGDNYGLLSWSLHLDGSGADLLAIPGGCAKYPCSEEVLKNKLHYIKMNGREVFKFSVRVIGEVTEEALSKAGLSSKDLNWLVPHQANIRIIEAGAERLGIPLDKVAINLQKYGNTSTASIPLALEELIKEKKLKDGDIVALVGFGAGLSWGSAVMRWKEI